MYSFNTGFRKFDILPLCIEAHQLTFSDVCAVNHWLVAVFYFE